MNIANLVLAKVGFNRIIKQVKRVGCGFTNVDNYRRRIMAHIAVTRPRLQAAQVPRTGKPAHPIEGRTHSLLFVRLSLRFVSVALAAATAGKSRGHGRRTVQRLRRRPARGFSSH